MTADTRAAHALALEEAPPFSDSPAEPDVLGVPDGLDGSPGLPDVLDLAGLSARLDESAPLLARHGWWMMLLAHAFGRAPRGGAGRSAWRRAYHLVGA